jgi:hypothetical protein
MVTADLRRTLPVCVAFISEGRTTMLIFDPRTGLTIFVETKPRG